MTVTPNELTAHMTIELLNIDCMEYMATQPDNAFDLAIVDPPYGIGFDNQMVRVKPNRPNTYARAANGLT